MIIAFTEGDNTQCLIDESNPVRIGAEFTAILRTVKDQLLENGILMECINLGLMDDEEFKREMESI